MSEDFIPLNQSTPVHQKRWQSQSFNQFSNRGQRGNWKQNSRRGGLNKWGNNSQLNSSFGIDNNRNDGRGTRERTDLGIDAYLHPSMLQDPWAYLRRRNAENQQN